LFDDDSLFSVILLTEKPRVLTAYIQAAIERDEGRFKSLLKDPDCWTASGVRGTVVEAIGRSGHDDPSALALLCDMVVKDTGPVIRRVALRTIARFWRDDPGTLPLLRDRAVNDTDLDVRLTAIRLVGLSWPHIGRILEESLDQEISQAEIRKRVKIIEETLLSLGVPAKVVEVNRGPVITQFSLEPGFIEGRGGKRMEVKVSKISALADDLALALAASPVRVVAPVPGRSIVGIEVPNADWRDREVTWGDDLFKEAVAVVRKYNRASISLLQRRLRIGYSRATRLMDLLEEWGVVGPDRGADRSREVLLL